MCDRKLTAIVGIGIGIAIVADWDFVGAWSQKRGQARLHSPRRIPLEPVPVFAGTGIGVDWDFNLKSWARQQRREHNRYQNRADWDFVGAWSQKRGQARLHSPRRIPLEPVPVFAEYRFRRPVLTWRGSGAIFLGYGDCHLGLSFLCAAETNRLGRILF